MAEKKLKPDTWGAYTCFIAHRPIGVGTPIEHVGCLFDTQSYQGRTYEAEESPMN